MYEGKEIWRQRNHKFRTRIEDPHAKCKNSHRSALLKDDSLRRLSVHLNNFGHEGGNRDTWCSRKINVADQTGGQTWKYTDNWCRCWRNIQLTWNLPTFLFTRFETPTPELKKFLSTVHIWTTKVMLDYLKITIHFRDPLEGSMSGIPFLLRQLEIHRDFRSRWKAKSCRGRSNLRNAIHRHEPIVPDDIQPRGTFLCSNLREEWHLAKRLKLHTGTLHMNRSLFSRECPNVGFIESMAPGRRIAYTDTSHTNQSLTLRLLNV